MRPWLVQCFEFAPSPKKRVDQHCYHCLMFNFGKPKTAADWLVHVAGAIVALFLVWWLLRLYVL